MNIWLIVGTLTMTTLAGLHSYIGETKLLQRLLAISNLPTLEGSESYTKTVLRWAWHLTSLAWLGFAGIFIVLTQIPINSRFMVSIILTICLGLSAIIVLVVTRGRHPAWIGFLVSTICAILGMG